MKSFWAARAIAVATHEVKSRHTEDRMADRKRRWSVRQFVRDDGVTSNLFPIKLSQNNSPNLVYRYELEVSRKLRTPQPGDVQPARTVGTVSPNRAWKVFAQSLRKYPSLPPLVRVGSRIYCTEPIPKQLLELPPEFLDLGWEKCRLELVDRVDVTTLSPPETRQMLNKMLPWALNFHAQKDGSFSVVREVDGKMVCTEDGMSVAGLRVFRGTTAAVLHINAAGEEAPEPSDAPDAAIPQSQVLATLKPNQQPPHTAPIEVRCLKHHKEFEYRGKLVQSYFCADASGTILLTLWGYRKGILKTNCNYVLESGIKVQASAPRYNRGDFPYELHAVNGIAKFHEAENASGESPSAATAAGKVRDDEASTGYNNLVLRLDTRCTIASERSLWDEIKQHFGPGPYDEDKQRRITRAVQGTPVVMSTSLRHAQVRSVRFNISSAEEAPLEPHLKEMAHEFDPQQPFAVMNDYSVLPLQVLHCCFDPKMRSWQDVTVPACSFFPKRRAVVLGKFRAALEQGLCAWNIGLNIDPWNTKQIAILAEPEKVRGHQGATASSGSTKPKIVVVVAICHSRGTPEDKQRCVKTAQSLSKYMRTPHMAEVSKEDEALKYVSETLIAGGKLKDPECAVVFVAPERETKAMRWLIAECMKRGVLPVSIRGVASEKRQKLLNGNVALQLISQYATNPVKNINVTKEVPALTGKNILIVGVDACHTHDITTGACVGLLITPTGACWFPSFWRNEIRGQEVEQVAENFGQVILRALKACGGEIAECVVFQDGNVFSELDSMKAHVPANCGLSFLCLHKRTHIRFVHKDSKAEQANVVKGAVVQALTPVAHGHKPVAPSFYLQSHECNMSTARTVQFTVHHISTGLSSADLQRLSFVLSHCASPMSTKLPIATRAAHRLASIAERLIDACPDFRSELIPETLSSRSWFL